MPILITVLATGRTMVPMTGNTTGPRIAMPRHMPSPVPILLPLNTSSMKAIGSSSSGSGDTVTPRTLDCHTKTVVGTMKFRRANGGALDAASRRVKANDVIRPLGGGDGSGPGRGGHNPAEEAGQHRGNEEREERHGEPPGS